MRKNRRNFAVLLLAIGLAMMLGVYTFAEGTEKPEFSQGNEFASELPTESERLTESKKMGSDSVGFFDRISEYLTGDKLAQTVTFAYNIFCTILLVVMKRSTTHSSRDLLKIVTADNKSAKEMMNKLAEVYNANEKEVGELKQEIIKLREEHEVKTVTTEQFTAVLEGIRDIGVVLQTIYQNSSTVPVVIKNEVIKKIAELNDIIDKAEEKGAENDE